MSSAAATPPSPRLTSLDQFRGYTMFGMLLVNFLGGYAVCPRIMRHTNDYCSYADTIMPQFFFAAGFAMRLSLGKRREQQGSMPWGRAIRRILGLALVAIVWYTIGDWNSIVAKFQTQPPLVVIGTLFKRNYFQTLLHIAVTSLWILPVVTASWRVRLLYLYATAALHIFVSWWFNFLWIYADPGGIDGGPLGFLTWAIPALCGTLACDAVRASGPRAARRLCLSGLVVMVIGWFMSMGTVLYNVPQSVDAVDSNAGSTVSPRPVEKLPPDPVIPSWERIKRWDGTIVEPPFVPPPDVRHRQWNYWMMSQRTGNLSYLTFSAGLSLVLFAFFLWGCDTKGFRLGLFRTLGTNSLAAYILHDIWGWVLPYLATKSSVFVAGWNLPESVSSVLLNLFHEKSTLVLPALLSFALFAFCVYASCRVLERLGWYIRV